ncbi:uncharacterized protein fto [Engraulis encrasicolus]|uniref:uncharacterized protein fto n=1 Tax=Engraulis encrasicolus TaxID=184585 RepID=UPI002FCF1AF8
MCNNDSIRKLQVPGPPSTKARLCKHYSRNMKRSDDSEREKRRKRRRLLQELGDQRIPFLSPSDPGYQQLWESSYTGLALRPSGCLPDGLHERVQQALLTLRGRGCLLRDLVRVRDRDVLTAVSRALLGQPGHTYRYLDTRLFAIPWHADDPPPQAPKDQSINQNQSQAEVPIGENGNAAKVKAKTLGVTPSSTTTTTTTTTTTSSSSSTLSSTSSSSAIQGCCDPDLRAACRALWELNRFFCQDVEKETEALRHRKACRKAKEKAKAKTKGHGDKGHGVVTPWRGGGGPGSDKGTGVGARTEKMGQQGTCYEGDHPRGGKIQEGTTTTTTTTTKEERKEGLGVGGGGGGGGRGEEGEAEDEQLLEEDEEEQEQEEMEMEMKEEEEEDEEDELTKEEEEDLDTGQGCSSYTIPTSSSFSSWSSPPPPHFKSHPPPPSHTAPPLPPLALAQTTQCSPPLKAPAAAAAAAAVALGGGPVPFNITLLNYMEPSSMSQLKEEPYYGMGKMAVGWHHDENLVPLSPVAVYNFSCPAAEKAEQPESDTIATPGAAKDAGKGTQSGSSRGGGSAESCSAASAGSGAGNSGATAGNSGGPSDAGEGDSSGTRASMTRGVTERVTERDQGAKAEGSRAGESSSSTSTSTSTSTSSCSKGSERQASCWRVGLKVAWDIHTPGLALPLQSGDCYYMTDDLNRTHQHCVLAGDSARFSSTHRVAQCSTGTLDYIQGRCAEALQNLKVDPDTGTGSLHSLQPSTLEHCEEIHNEVEFEWLRQYWFQGRRYARFCSWWSQPMEQLERDWRQMENMTHLLLGVVEDENTAQEQRREMADTLLNALTDRQQHRQTWRDRCQSSLAQSLPLEEAPLDRPYWGPDDPHMPLPFDLADIISRVESLLWRM